MEPSCIRQTLLPGTTRLFGDYLYDFDRVRDFYGHHFLDPAALPAAAQSIDFPEARRKALVSALRQQNGDSATLDRLARPGTVAVVTGQQVGLFSGPAYTIFKALTAVRLADHLNRQGICAVPVFCASTPHAHLTASRSDARSPCCQEPGADGCIQSRLSASIRH
jgi:bacillithiol synthase